MDTIKIDSDLYTGKLESLSVSMNALSITTIELNMII